MESTTAAHTQSESAVGSRPMEGTQAAVSTTPAGQRGTILAKRLLFGDSLAAVLSASLTLVILGLLGGWEG
ncbi:MAG: hypothetical protein QOI84_1564, partial [Solirubrobacterales bacterium]|nr:hypothetical protein [Solirubrobacterales bacterium]